MKITTSIAATRTDLPVDGIRGFPITNLAGLYLFDGTDTTSLVKNWAPAGGTTATAFGGDALDAASLMAGGGINLKATAYVPGPVIDWTQPWTAVWQGQIGQPTNPAGASPWITGLIMCQQTAVRGMAMYASVGTSYPTPQFAVTANLRQSVNSVQDSPISTAIAPGLVYTSIATVCLRYDGNVTADAIFMRGGSILSSVTKTNVNATGMTTNSSSVQVKNLSHSLGSPTTTFNRANISPEGFAVYTEYVSNTKLALIDQAFSAIRTARGR
jgi:hypothetical protein